MNDISPLGPLCNCEEFERRRRRSEAMEGGIHMSSSHNEGENVLKEYSPRWLLQDTNMNMNSSEDDHENGSHDIIYSNQVLSTMPPLLLLHGGNDTTALPIIQSRLVYDIETKRMEEEYEYQVSNSNGKSLRGLEHQDLVVATCLGSGFKRRIRMKMRMRMIIRVPLRVRK